MAYKPCLFRLHKAMINAKELGEEFIVVKATTTVKWLLQARHCR
jgi:hypothetical protein